MKSIRTSSISIRLIMAVQVITIVRVKSNRHLIKNRNQIKGMIHSKSMYLPLVRDSKLRKYKLRV